MNTLDDRGVGFCRRDPQIDLDGSQPNQWGTGFMAAAIGVVQDFLVASIDQGVTAVPPTITRSARRRANSPTLTTPGI